jgi:FkbM family methyltransferase
MNLKDKIHQTKMILSNSRSPSPLLLDVFRIKKRDYVGECRDLKFQLLAGSFEWFTLYENIIREDYFRNGISLKSGDLVIDIGANFGSFAMLAAKKVGPTGSVIAFEPNPDAYLRLVRSVELNGFKNVVARNEAVSADDGEMVLYLQKKSSLVTAFNSIDGRETDTLKAVKVKAASIRSVINESPREINLMKIDCEGGEYSIFDVLNEELLQKVRQISMELHDIEGRSKQEIASKLVAAGYELKSDGARIMARRA